MFSVGEVLGSECQFGLGNWVGVSVTWGQGSLECDRVLGSGVTLSVPGRRVPEHCAPGGPGTLGSGSFPDGPPACRRANPSSTPRSRPCCHCLLGGRGCRWRD